MTRPPGPSSQQLLRALPSIRRFVPDFLVRTVAEFGDIVAFPVPGQAVFLAGSPAAAHDILVTDPHAWTRQTPQYVSLARLTGAGLLTSDGDTWRHHRRLLAPAFARGGLPVVTEVAQAAAGGIDLPRGRLDVQALSALLSLEILGDAVLGIDLRRHARELVAAVLTSLDAVIADVEDPQPLPPQFPTPRRRRFAAATRHIDDAAWALLKAARTGAHGEQRIGGRPEGLVATLADAIAQGRLTPIEARDELVTAIVAGHETVGCAMGWTLWLLAHHPAWQERARHDDETLRAVVTESLRLYPPAWVMSRRAARPVVVAGQPVPEGALAIISPWQLHRRANVFVRPDEFDPGRFLASPPPRQGYLPFGAGPRLCIGREVALAEMTAVIGTLLRRASFQPAQPAPQLRAAVTVMSRNGIHLWAEPL